MADPAEIEATIERYWATFSAGDRDGWLALFADDATIEDPVGTPLREGTEAIGAFFDQSQQMTDRITLEGCTVQVCGHEAAFHMQIRPVIGGSEYRLDAIDVMTFDDEARITSMRAFFDPAKMRPAPG
jgi:steroid Delta-isomerase